PLDGDERRGRRALKSAGDRSVDERRRLAIVDRAGAASREDEKRDEIARHERTPSKARTRRKQRDFAVGVFPRLIVVTRSLPQAAELELDRVERLGADARVLTPH